MGLIRLLLALAVVLAHSTPIFGFSFMSGKMAVQAFYIISGFYMSLILNEKYNSYKLFITNRFLRLFPLYWIVLLLTFLFCIIGMYISGFSEYGRLDGFHDYSKYLDIFSLIAIIFSNVFLFFQDILMFFHVNNLGEWVLITNATSSTIPLYKFLLVPQAWTIGVEISFYLIAPFIVRKNTLIIVFLLIASLSIKYFFYYNNLTYDPWSYRFFLAEMTFFLLGILSYKIYVRIRDFNFNKFLMHTLLIFQLFYILIYNYISFDLNEILYFVVFFVSLPFLFILSKKWKTDRLIGELSYPVYISHIFIITLLNAFLKKLFHISEINELGLLTITFSIVFSIISNKLVVSKIEEIRTKRAVS